MPLLLPPWRARSDAELRELVREVWEGRVVGSWQLEGAGTECQRVFPGFSELQWLAAVDDAARAASGGRRPRRPPSRIPAAAFARPRTKVPAPGVGRLPVCRRWELLSLEEWRRLSALLADPLPATNASPDADDAA